MFVNRRVRCVIGGDSFDNTSGQRVNAGLDIRFCTKRRIDLGVGVVEQIVTATGDGFVSQTEMMRRHFGVILFSGVGEVYPTQWQISPDGG